MVTVIQGNECRSLLNNLDVLDALLPDEHYAYLTAFKAFDAVVTSCFGYDLDPCYLTYIRAFENAWLDLKLPITPKVHVLIEHLEEDLKRYGHGTALLNESAGEAIHADFDTFYRGFIVKDLSATAYTKKLLQAVQIYNSNHV